MFKVNLDLICDSNEQANERMQYEMYKKVIDEYGALCNVDFREITKFDDDYKTFDYLFQISVAKPEIFKEFHEILEKYNFDDMMYIDYAIKKITMNASNVQSFLDGLSSIGIIKDIYELKDNSINIISEMGNFSFYAADEYYQKNEEIVNFIKETYVRGNCHDNALFMLKQLKKGEAITARCRSPFEGSYYHSYYRENGMICDLNNNVVMKESEFNLIYMPEIISIVNMKNFDEQIENLKCNCESTLKELLGIAIYKEFNENKGV